MTPTSFPCLYILMRSDMASLNPGKAMAQATHAANECVFLIRKWAKAAEEKGKNYQKYDHFKKMQKMLESWEEDRGFGTCIVLDIGSEANLQEFVAAAGTAGLRAGITHDPSYPVRDGDVTHLIPVDTCGFVFGEKEECSKVLGSLPLYK